ncbi:unnamed protein product [Toxocara canis]|uniref:Uncharacterized protein n=1 Tax=Toxocara canis TaxID=6265 RepID=A0A183TYT2_TOXCA|nr:unnamed protein product [Toxocara canis]
MPASDNTVEPRDVKWKGTSVVMVHDVVISRLVTPFLLKIMADQKASASQAPLYAKLTTWLTLRDMVASLAASHQQAEIAQQYIVSKSVAESTQPATVPLGSQRRKSSTGVVSARDHLSLANDCPPCCTTSSCGRRRTVRSSTEDDVMFTARKARSCTGDQTLSPFRNACSVRCFGLALYITQISLLIILRDKNPITSVLCERLPSGLQSLLVLRHSTINHVCDNELVVN